MAVIQVWGIDIMVADPPKTEERDVLIDSVRAIMREVRLRGEKVYGIDLWISREVASQNPELVKKLDMFFGEHINGKDHLAFFGRSADSIESLMSQLRVEGFNVDWRYSAS